MAEKLDDQIRENAKQPRRASADGVEAEQHPLKDQIEADRYLVANNTMENDTTFWLTIVLLTRS